MKIIYGGGWDKNSKASIENSFVYTYCSVIKNAIKKGNKIAFVTLAKPDGYYLELLRPLYGDRIEIIDSTNQNIDWSIYDGIFILGGKAVDLLSGLVNKKFSLERLKNNVVILGDSAGAYVLSAYFYDSPPGELRGKQIQMVKGLNIQSKLITIAHNNNPVYCNELLINKVKDFAKAKNIKVLVLNENEQKIVDNGQFVEVDKNSLFT